jgi:hypothetical protein
VLEPEHDQLNRPDGHGYASLIAVMIADRDGSRLSAHRPDGMKPNDALR